MKTLLISVVLVLGLAGTSFASLVLDVTDANGNKFSWPNPVDLSNSYMRVRLWAIVTGSDANPYNDGITAFITNMIVTTTGATDVIGLTTLTKAAAFSSATGQMGLSQDLNGDGIKDWGSNAGTPADAGYAYFISKDAPNPIYGDTTYTPLPTPEGNGMRYLLGTFRLAVGPWPLFFRLEINAQIPTYPGTTAKGIWFEDNATWPPTDEFGDPNPNWNPTDPTYRKLWLDPAQGSIGTMSVGAPLIIGIPEPSTLVLLVTGALALPLLYRRRKRK